MGNCCIKGAKIAKKEKSVLIFFLPDEHKEETTQIFIQLEKIFSSETRIDVPRLLTRITTYLANFISPDHQWHATNILLQAICAGGQKPSSTPGISLARLQLQNLILCFLLEKIIRTTPARMIEAGFFLSPPADFLSVRSITHFEVNPEGNIALRVETRSGISHHELHQPSIAAFLEANRLHNIMDYRFKMLPSYQTEPATSAAPELPTAGSMVESRAAEHSESMTHRLVIMQRNGGVVL